MARSATRTAWLVDALAFSDLAPSEVRDLLAIESNLLAHHLDVLSEAGVVERAPSHGDRRRYLHLRREALAAIAQPLTIAATGVLFVCTANSARSQLAAALWAEELLRAADVIITMGCGDACPI